MSTTPKPETSEKNTKGDLDTYERLPEKKKELMELKDHDEKATGQERVETTRKIKDKGRQSQP